MTTPTIGLRHMFFALDAQDTYIATLYIERRHQVLWLTSLWVAGAHRKQHLATQMLKQCIEEYGQEDIYLQVMAGNDQPLNDAELVAWYQRFGFEQTTIPGILCRQGNVQ